MITQGAAQRSAPGRPRRGRCSSRGRGRGLAVALGLGRAVQVAGVHAAHQAARDRHVAHLDPCARRRHARPGRRGALPDALPRARWRIAVG
jgi:hypothetical protein